MAHGLRAAFDQVFAERTGVVEDPSQDRSLEAAFDVVFASMPEEDQEGFNLGRPSASEFAGGALETLGGMAIQAERVFERYGSAHAIAEKLGVVSPEERKAIEDAGVKDPSMLALERIVQPIGEKLVGLAPEHDPSTGFLGELSRAGGSIAGFLPAGLLGPAGIAQAGILANGYSSYEASLRAHPGDTEKAWTRFWISAPGGAAEAAGVGKLGKILGKAFSRIDKVTGNQLQKTFRRTLFKTMGVGAGRSLEEAGQEGFQELSDILGEHLTAGEADSVLEALGELKADPKGALDALVSQKGRIGHSMIVGALAAGPFQAVGVGAERARRRNIIAETTKHLPEGAGLEVLQAGQDPRDFQAVEGELEEGAESFTTSKGEVLAKVPEGAPSPVTGERPSPAVKEKEKPEPMSPKEIAAEGERIEDGQLRAHVADNRRAGYVGEIEVVEAGEEHAELLELGAQIGVQVDLVRGEGPLPIPGSHMEGRAIIDAGQPAQARREQLLVHELSHEMRSVLHEKGAESQEWRDIVDAIASIGGGELLTASGAEYVARREAGQETLPEPLSPAALEDEAVAFLYENAPGAFLHALRDPQATMALATSKPGVFQRIIDWIRKTAAKLGLGQDPRVARLQAIVGPQPTEVEQHFGPEVMAQLAQAVAPALEAMAGRSVAAGALPVGPVAAAEPVAQKETAEEPQADQGEAESEPRFAAAYHGTGAKFDKFSDDAIGTGEGAQAYGYGHYFASNKKVAEWYRKNLAGTESIVMGDGEKFGWSGRGNFPTGREHSTAREILSRAKSSGRDLQGVAAERAADLLKMADAAEAATSGNPKVMQARADGMRRDAKFAQRVADDSAAKIDSGGHLLQVDLAPAEDEYLLWDAPLSEQSEKVRGAIAQMGLRAEVDDWFEASAHVRGELRKVWRRATQGGGVVEVAEVDGAWVVVQGPLRDNAYGFQLEAMQAVEAEYPAHGATGEVLYQRAQQEFDAPANAGRSAPMASAALLRAGIRGIKYLEGASRAKGEGNYNYVVFDPEDVTITARFAVAPPTDSAAFRNWFQNSKVVDESGAPLVVYHGTPEEVLGGFDETRQGRNTDPGWLGRGFYFTTDPSVAEWYARERGGILPVYLSIQNPLVIDLPGVPKQAAAMRVLALPSRPIISGDTAGQEALSEEIRVAALAAGYDGVEYHFEFDKSVEYVAFTPTQVKSATGNVGTYDPANADVRFAVGPRRVPYYRTTESATEMFGVPDKDAPFDRGYEPSGEYFTPLDKPLEKPAKGQISGVFEFRNPLVLPAGGYGKATSWKRVLSKRYGGLTGRDLSRAIVDDGYDAVLTEDENGNPSEGVNLQTFDYKKARFAVADISFLTQTQLQRHIQLVQNTMEGYGRLGKALRTAGREDLAEKAELTEQMATLWADRGTNRWKETEKAHVEPFFDYIKKHWGRGGNVLERVQKYLYARHAPERNRVILERNGKQDGSGMSNYLARLIVAGAESSEMGAQYQEMGRLWDQMMTANLDMAVEYGLISQQHMDTLQEMYAHYVPLKTLADDTERAGLGLGRGADIRGPEFKMALGRGSEADAPIAHGLAAIQRTIMRGEKTAVVRPILELLREFGGEIPGVAKMRKPRRVTMKRDVETGEMIAVFDNTEPDSELIVGVKEEGVEYRIEFMPEYADMAEALHVLTARQVGEVTRHMGQFTRYLSGMATRWNPVFPVFNAVRDVGTAFFTSQEHGMAFASRVVRDAPAAWAALMGITKSGKWVDGLEAYKREGAMMVFLGIDDPEGHLRKVRADLGSVKDLKGTGMRRAAKSVIGVFELFSDAVENAARLSTFVNAQENLNMTPVQAASYAKGITTNFRKKGLMGNYMNSWWMFSNAGLQGSFRVGKALKVRQVQTVVASAVVASMMLDWINRIMSATDDDDESYYDSIPGYVKRNNIIIPTTLTPKTGDDYVTIPAPFVFNWFHSLGTNIGALSWGMFHDDQPQTVGGASLDMLAASFDSFNPLGGTDQFMTMILPTVLDPVAELSTNKDFAGRSIAKRPFPGQTAPQSQQFWPDVNPTARKITTWLNEVGGGDEFEAGAMLLDINPEHVQYMIKFGTSGAGATAGRMYNLADKSLNGEPIEKRDIPLLRRFVKDPSPYALGQRYKEAQKEIAVVKKRVKSLHDRKEHAAAREAQKEHVALYRLRDRALTADRRIKQKRELIEKASEARKAQLEEDIRKIQADLIKRVKDAKG